LEQDGALTDAELFAGGSAVGEARGKLAGGQRCSGEVVDAGVQVVSFKSVFLKALTA